MPKRIAYIHLFIRTFISRHNKHLMLSALCGFFITLFVFQIYPLYISLFGRKVQHIGLRGSYNASRLPKSIQNQLSFGLTTLAQDGQAIPSLATTWDINPKGTEYVFHLQPNLIWHDGTKFTSKDINYTLKGAQFIPVDDFTLKVTLQEPYAALLTVLSQPLFRPNLVGLGNYKVSKLIYNEDVISELVITPLQNKVVPTLIYKFYRSNAEAILAFKLGEVDTLMNISDITDMTTWKNVKITKLTQYDQFIGIFINLRNSLFKEKEIRQALAYALPKFENVEKAYTPISPLSWAYSQKIRLYNTDIEAAQKILSKSPLASSSTQLTLSTIAPLLADAEKIAESWNSAGISVKVKVENTLPDDYMVALLPQVIPADPDQYQLWQSTQEDINVTHYANQKIDQLLEVGRKTLDIDARKKIYADFQRYLVDDAPVLFLYYPTIYTVERK